MTKEEVERSLLSESGVGGQPRRAPASQPSAVEDSQTAQGEGANAKPPARHLVTPLLFSCSAATRLESSSDADYSVECLVLYC